MTNYIKTIDFWGVEFNIRTKFVSVSTKTNVDKNIERWIGILGVVGSYKLHPLFAII